MKSYEMQRFGLDGLVLTEQDIPSIADDEVLMKVHALSVNYRDYLVIVGKYNAKLPLPFTPFSDAAGEVIEIGQKVNDLKVGDKIVSCFFQDWQQGELSQQAAFSALGGALPGVLSEYIVLNAKGVIKFPKHLTYEEAATLPCSALTAWCCLLAQHNGMHKNDSLLLLGTGGVSIAALQFAKAYGLEVVMTSKDDQKLAIVEKLGAKYLINYLKSPTWSKAVKAVCPQGVNRVIEVGGVGTLEESLKSLTFAGSAYFIGLLASPKDPPMLNLLIMKGLTLQGIVVGPKAEFIRMNQFITDNAIKPYIDKIFDFSEVKQALEYFILAKHIGKICIRIEHEI